MRTTAILLLCMSFVVSQTCLAGQITDFGRLEGRVLDQQTGSPIKGAVVALEWGTPSSEAPAKTGTCDEKGAYTLGVPLGLSKSSLDLGRAASTSMLGLALGILGGGKSLSKKTRVVMVDGVAATVTAEGYKPFRGHIPFARADAERFITLGKDVLLAPEADTAVSRVSQDASLYEFEVGPLPDKVWQPTGAEIPVSVTYRHWVPLCAPNSVNVTTEYVWGSDKTATTTLYDDGKHSDGEAKDAVFAGTLKLPAAKTGPADVLLCSFEVSRADGTTLSRTISLPVAGEETGLAAARKLIEGIAAGQSGSHAERCMAKAPFFRAASAARPDCPKILSSATWMLVEAGLEREAAEFFESAPAETKNDAKAHREYVRALSRLGRHEEVIKQLEGLKFGTGDDRGYFLGVAYLNKGDLTLGGKYLATFEGRSKDPEYRDGYCSWRAAGKLAQAQAAKVPTKHYTDMLIWTEKMASAPAPDTLDKMTACALDGLRAKPTGAQARDLASRCIRALALRGDADAAMRLAKDVSALSQDPCFTAEALKKAATLVQQDKPAVAAQLLNESVSINAQDAEALSRLAALLREDDPPRALALWQQAIDLGSTEVEPYLMVGADAERAGKYPEAQAVYAKGVTLNDASFDLHHGLARMLILTGKTDEALVAFRKAAARGREDRSILDEAAVEGFAGFVAPIWTKERRVSVCGYAAPMAQWDFYIAEIGSELLATATPAADGKPEQEKKLNYTGPVYQGLLGEALVQAGLPEKAIPLLEGALALAPELLDAKLALAQACGSTGNVDRARALLEEVRHACPDDENVIKALEALGE